MRRGIAREGSGSKRAAGGTLTAATRSFFRDTMRSCVTLCTSRLPDPTIAQARASERMGARTRAAEAERVGAGAAAGAPTRTRARAAATRT